MLDTLRSVATPEGVRIELDLAGPLPRARAWVTDLLLRAVLWWVLLIVSRLLSEGGLGGTVFLLSMFLLEWLYPVLFEVYWHGATPGKRLIGLAVVRDDGVPVSWVPSLVRNLLRVADFLPIPYGFGILSMLTHPEFRRLGDIAAGTVVVHVPRPAQVAPLPAGPSRPPAVPLGLAEQQAILTFADRVGRLTPERAAELAAILQGSALAPAGTSEELVACARHLGGMR
jgi:uncharacterized RDD family membrane protein YckC